MKYLLSPPKYHISCIDSDLECAPWYWLASKHDATSEDMADIAQLCLCTTQETFFSQIDFLEPS